MHPERDEHGREHEHSEVDERDEEEDEPLGVVVQARKRGPVATAEKVGDLRTHGLREHGENLAAHGEDDPHEAEGRYRNRADEALQEQERRGVGEERTHLNEAEVAAAFEDVFDGGAIPEAEAGEELGCGSAEIDENADGADKKRGKLDAGEHRERRVEGDAGEQTERAGHGLRVVPMGSAMCESDAHEDAREVAEQDHEEDLNGEEIERPLRGGAGDVELQDVIERDEEERQQKHCRGDDDAEQQPQRRGLANVVALGFAALEADGEILVHVGLHAEVQHAERRDSA